MESSGRVRYTIQAAALIIFAYQMCLAVYKYTRFSSLPVVETKDVADAKLPDIYICLDDQNITENLMKHGYYGMDGFLVGVTLDWLAPGTTYVSWEGIHNQTYEKITGSDVSENTECFCSR